MASEEEVTEDLENAVIVEADAAASVDERAC